MVHGNGGQALDMAREHLEEFPADAYILSQYIGLRKGPGCRGSSSAILGYHRASEPSYGDDWFYTGARSFQLHELDRFDESRRFAERSLNGNPRNGNAAHNLAHCFYETADYEGGLDFLNGWIVEYHPDAPHYSHLNWHKALFDLTQGRYESSYDVYRASIRPSVLKQDVGAFGPPVADATSLFWRYRLYGSPLERSEDWQEIDQFAQVVAAGGRSGFYDAHCALAFAATGNSSAMTSLIDALREVANDGHALTAEVTLPLVLGIDAFGREAYAETIDHIEPIYDDLVRINGSQAQRLVFEETLLRAYMLTGRYEKAESMLPRSSRAQALRPRLLLASRSRFEPRAHRRRRAKPRKRTSHVGGRRPELTGAVSDRALSRDSPSDRDRRGDSTWSSKFNKSSHVFRHRDRAIARSIASQFLNMRNTQVSRARECENP